MTTEVVGGVGGLEVQYDELARASARLREQAGDVLALAASRHRLLADGDLLESALLSPGGFARVEAALLDALDGSDGLVAAGIGLELRGDQLLLAVARYRMSDALEAELVEARRWLLVASLPVLLPAAVVGGAGWAAGVVATGGDPVEELEELLVDHPGVLDELVNTVPMVAGPLRDGLAGPLPVLADQAFRAATGHTLLPADVAEAAGLLALLYSDAAPVQSARPDATPAGRQVPRGLGDLMERLDARNDAAGGATSGDIGVTRLVTTGSDGVERVSWVVDIPGTKDWQAMPGSRPGVNDLASNLELMAGEDNARVQALQQVLADAGAARGEPVMLVGHSQGGMVAVRAATALAGRFTVTHVVTAGSPVGTMLPPPGVQVLSLENIRDVVPHADGRANPDRLEHVTVLFDGRGGTVAGNHGIGTAYVPAARALDRSDDVSVRTWLDSAGAFLESDAERARATTTVYTVTNGADARG